MLRDYYHCNTHSLWPFPPPPSHVCQSIWYCSAAAVADNGLDKRNVIIMLTPIRNVIKMKILLKLVICRCHRRIIIFYQISAYPLLHIYLGRWLPSSTSVTSAAPVSSLLQLLRPGLRGSSTIIIITRQPFIVIYENLIWGRSLYSTPSCTFNCTHKFYWKIWRLNGFSSCFWLSDYTPPGCCCWWRLASRTRIWDFN